jgi:hypothetical protein
MVWRWFSRSFRLEALAGPLLRALPLRHSLVLTLGLSVDSAGGVLISRFGEGDGHPDCVPSLLKFHGVLLVMLACLSILRFNNRARYGKLDIYLI